jgi:hypothetical protein
MLWDKADLRTKEAKAAQDFMWKKGYPEIRPLGVVQVESQPCWYYYYELPEGVLELEVSEEPDCRYNRRVSAFVTDPERVRDLLDS